MSERRAWREMSGRVVRLLGRLRAGAVATPAPDKPAPPAIPDAHLYQPVYSPWLGDPAFLAIYERGKDATLVSADRCWVLLSLARQALALEGEIWECGAYRGGTAAMLAATIAAAAAKTRLRVFDTFAGMPTTDPDHDLHKVGDFSDTGVAEVAERVGHPEHVSIHEGFIPDSFRGLERSAVALAHVDTDIYRSVYDCCDFLYPRIVPGGFLVFDDYGFPTCPGARQAVDEFFASRPEVPLILPTGQAVVFKEAV